MLKINLNPNKFSVLKSQTKMLNFIKQIKIFHALLESLKNSHQKIIKSPKPLPELSILPKNN
jgi:hypothetical protein